MAAADKGEADASLPTFRYDLVNLGRELLAQLSVPVSLNLTDAMGLTSQSGKVDAARTEEVGRTYTQLLRDIDYNVKEAKERFAAAEARPRLPQGRAVEEAGSRGGRSLATP